MKTRGETKQMMRRDKMRPEEKEQRRDKTGETEDETRRRGKDRR